MSSGGAVLRAAAAAGGAEIRVEDVGVVFSTPTGGHLEALSGITLHVAAGEIVCIVGPSGCGKTTLLNLVAGFARPTSGRVMVAGRPVVGVGPDRLVVFQRPAVFPWLNVHDNVVFGLRHQGQTPQAYEPKARQILEATGLQGFERYYPYQLSGGMLQRTQIARCFVCAPPVLLLDEPFGALDAQTRFLMQELLLDVWAADQPTILFITHDVEEALFLADRIYVMATRPGRVLDEVAVPWGRPRSVETLATPDFARLKGRILQHLRAAASGG